LRPPCAESNRSAPRWKDVSGATKTKLVLKSSTAGKKITVKVIAHLTGHIDDTATSKPTKAVAR
jgi:hypothetical protein